MTAHTLRRCVRACTPTRTLPRALALSAVVVVMCAALVAVSRVGEAPPGPRAPLAALERVAGDHHLEDQVAAATATSRIDYRYSVVPRGVYSAAELLDAANGDPVVAAHYASFSIDRARAEPVAAPRRAYMSYRVGSRVFWTKEPLALVEGELILTDGTSAIRARCGNRLSDVAMEPTLAAEPLAIEFDRALAPPPSPTGFNPVTALLGLPQAYLPAIAGPAPIGMAPGLSPGLSPAGALATGPGSGGGLALVTPLVPGGVIPGWPSNPSTGLPADPPVGPPGLVGSVGPTPGGDPSTPGGDPSTPGGPIPPPGIPEPGTLLLVVAGLIGYAARRRAQAARTEEIGDRRQETGDRRQEIGDRR